MLSANCAGMHKSSAKDMHAGSLLQAPATKYGANQTTSWQTRFVLKPCLPALHAVLETKYRVASSHRQSSTSGRSHEPTGLKVVWQHAVPRVTKATQFGEVRQGVDAESCAASTLLCAVPHAGCCAPRAGAQCCCIGEVVGCPAGKGNTGGKRELMCAALGWKGVGTAAAWCCLGAVAPKGYVTP